MSHLKFNALGVASAIALCTAYSGATFAQIDEIVVTAQKREQSLQEVPIAISAFSREQLSRRQINDVIDLKNAIPSLIVGDSAGNGQISIRGVGFGLSSPTSENSVAVHRDGIYFFSPQAALLGQQDDLGRIEVLRGPQGTLYGRNATGGAINFISAAPTDEFALGISALGGNLDRHREKAYVSGPIADGLTFRVAVTNDERGDYVNIVNLPGEGMGSYNRQSLNIGVDADIGERFHIKFRGFGIEEEGQPEFSLIGPIGAPILGAFGALPGSVMPAFDLDEDEAVLNSQGFTEREMIGGSVRLSFDISENVEIVSLTGLHRFQIDSVRDSDNSGLNLFLNVPGANTNFGEEETISQEFNIIGDTGPLSWVVGLFYVDSKSTSQITLTNALIGLLDFDFTAYTESISFFADGTLNITDRLDLYGGVRYVHEDKELDARLFIAGFGGNQCGPTPDFVLTTPFSDDAVTGRVGLRYEFVDDVSAYVQFARGYKGIGYSVASCSDFALPETLDSVEVGLKSQIWGGRLTLNAAAFWYDYTDLQFERILATGTLMDNADGRVYGAEIDFNAFFTDKFSIDGAMTFLDTEYTEGTSSDAFGTALGPNTNSLQLGVPGAVTSLVGNDLLRSPTFSGTLGITYTENMGNKGTLIGRFEAGYTSEYQLRVFDSNSLDAQEGYPFLNAFLTYETPLEFADVELRMFGRNLTDEGVISAIVESTSRVGSREVGRTFGGEVVVEF